MSQEEGFVIECGNFFLGVPYPITGKTSAFIPLCSNTFFFPNYIYADCLDEQEMVERALASVSADVVALRNKCRALKATRNGGTIVITDSRVDHHGTQNVSTEPTVTKEHSVYTFQSWRNFISRTGHHVPYVEFVAVCEYAEEVRKDGH